MEENRKRNVQMKFRVDKDEYDFIVEKAKISGKRNLTQYLRTMAIAVIVLIIGLIMRGIVIHKIKDKFIRSIKEKTMCHGDTQENKKSK